MLSCIIVMGVVNVCAVSEGTIYDCLKNNKQGEILKDKENLITMYAEKFSDFNGDEWFAEDIILPLHFNVLVGYEDGTLRPNDTIVPAEVAKVLSATFESGLSNGSTNWYDNYFMTCSKAFTYGTYKDMGMGYRDYMENRAMTRAEIAYVIANYVDAGSGELNQYIERAKVWDIGSLSKFPDCQNIAIDDDGTLARDLEIMSAGYIPSRYAGALSYLHDKGVFKGDIEGTMSPLNGVQRCEVFALINRVCTATTSYTKNQFKLEGATAAPIAVEQQTPQTPQTPSSSERPYVSTPYGNTQFPENIKGTDYWYSSYQTDYNEWQSREPITVRWDDPYRPRVKAGDTFIAKDGTAYVLEGSGLYVGDTEIVGVGLPIACDEHRVSCKGKYLEEFGQPSTHEFGWISSDVSTGGNKYIISKTTGEGHWLTEWMSIRDATKPTEKGTNGQRTPDGYWVYLDSANDWYWTVGY